MAARVMIAAPKSGSGKTTVTCALLQALKNRGQQVVSFKCGPDYIDPIFHEKVIGVPAKNLDTFFTGEEQTRELFLRGITKGGYAVLEGVMGLFDGLGGVREEGSSYHLAKVTKTPIVLVVDGKGMSRSVIALIAGFLAYDTEHLIQGVILNRVSRRSYELLGPLLESELQIQALGFFPERRELQIGSRRLGLVMPDELEDIKVKLQAASENFEQTVSVEKIMKIAERAEEPIGKAGICEEPATNNEAGSILICKPAMADKPVIAVAKDEAFCFYYAQNLLMLQEYGAELEYFSPLHDGKLPDVCHALLFGGGYPELYARQLSENVMMRAAVRKAVDRGLPVVAECGGFMYLHSALTDGEGIRYDMAGVIPAACFDTGKLVRFGYIEIQEKQGYFLPEGEKIKGHEFHYYDSTDNGDAALAVKPVTGSAYPCVIADETRWMGFAHLYYPSNPVFVKRFVEKARARKVIQCNSSAL